MLHIALKLQDVFRNITVEVQDVCSHYLQNTLPNLAERKDVKTTPI
jgi:hypothetical protein